MDHRLQGVGARVVAVAVYNFLLNAGHRTFNIVNAYELECDMVLKTKQYSNVCNEINKNLLL